ncbi:Trk family potassium uptake protein [Clostridium botulinum]|uniref:ATP synthase subunit J n=1 Tax=Clostridium botulinum C/D str. DC5 TaxID=1443128 RepID=A0A0A0IF50_CLOBO|nr:TrkH family potassium uptake protein [Clostridium botulinum]KGM97173.1 ATP synthase subunit J [Clostridium botulinum D str. CCUG 7971]KGM99612.1 ATP synthase subunit J [Clostridium botulinum C/D str. DC5]KOC50025.1 ATP synthase subunit J [Clostridium botulinum]KOC50299.1 ATP synthase subunit J [Clostridium botulinum]KOC52001.1 ATP synthase subunit J [Clostridium botulinum]
MANLKKRYKRRLTPVQTLALGFFIVIMVGTMLLMLPIASKSGVITPFVDALFTSTSAVCITGLTTLNTAAHWSYFGTTIIIILIQVGGLGFMSFATLIALLLGKRITLKERLVMQEAMNSFSLQGLVKLAKYILIFTFSVEGIGALFLSTKFIPRYGLLKGIYFSVFHSISAFCNAGFDLTGDSLVPYATNTVVILTISLLIIVSGLGFAVWAEIYNYKGVGKFSTHSKVAISMTAFLVIVGWGLMYLFEMKNPQTIQYMSIKGKLLSSLFAAVSPRTAGFYSISLPDMTLAGKVLTMILMFIGGCPGGTAGGVKTTTIGILLMTVICVIKNREDTQIFERTIGKNLVYKSFVIVTIAMGVVIMDTMILSFTETGASLEYILYEITSAFGTVGLTLGLTPKLSIIGKLLICATMYIGRLGPLTLVMALSSKKDKSLIKYPDGKILVG